MKNSHCNFFGIVRIQGAADLTSLQLTLECLKHFQIRWWHRLYKHVLSLSVQPKRRCEVNSAGFFIIRIFHAVTPTRCHLATNHSDLANHRCCGFHHLQDHRKSTCAGLTKNPRVIRPKAIFVAFQPWKVKLRTPRNQTTLW